MKKFLIFTMTLMCLMSCAKDDLIRTVYKSSEKIENVNYSLEVTQINDTYNWTVSNAAEEASHTYKFNYDSKMPLRLDFADIVAGLNAIDDEDYSILPMFSVNFRFTNVNEPTEKTGALMKYDKGGVVLVKFYFGSREFTVPYNMVIGANDKLNPKDSNK